VDSYYTRDYNRYKEHEYRTGYREGFSDAKPRNCGLRRSRDGIIFGVCQGFADWLGIPAWPLRLAAFISFIASGFFPIGALYLIAAFVMKPESR
jgi:phage shock protein PspC (stress-responsive transcriptional regulator)